MLKSTKTQQAVWLHAEDQNSPSNKRSPVCSACETSWVREGENGLEWDICSRCPYRASAVEAGR